jgi:DEAD/DEAH box helicase domain-containing protein
MAVEYWRKGEIDKLREYCLQDVRVTRDVYDFALQNGHVSYNDRQGQAQRISLPLSLPNTEVKQAINLSLGL